MDWQLAISRNRDALLRILVALYALAGLSKGGVSLTLPRHVYRSILWVLRPAESAVRRLIIIAAHGLVVAPRPARAEPVRFDPLPSRAAAQGLPAFRLIDPLKRFTTHMRKPITGEPPRISVPGFFDPVFVVPVAVTSEDPIRAVQLFGRLNALVRALETLPRQARRLARWQARRSLVMLSRSRHVRLSPCRPGAPPGGRRRGGHEVHSILKECHSLVLDIIALRDTS
jgi:hypothetical protein